MNSVIFDMDGVLFDSERIYYKAWLEAGRNRSLPAIDACVMHCIGRNGSDIRAYLLSRYGADLPVDDFIAEIRSAFRRIVDRDGLPVKPGVLDILDWLTENGWPVALATSSGKTGTAHNLDAAGLNKYFKVVVTGDMIRHGKPAPDIYILACEKLGVTPADCYAVEDSPNGIRSAHAAGLTVIFIPDMVEPAPEVVRLANRTFPSLGAFKDYLAAKPD